MTRRRRRLALVGASVAGGALLVAAGASLAMPDPEPTDHPTAFTAVGDRPSRITTTWTDAAGATPPTGYLVLCTSGAAIAPTDGTPVTDDIDCADGAGALNVGPGVESAEWNGFTESTARDFVVFPFTNTGVDIDYKTDSPPTASATTGACPSFPLSVGSGLELNVAIDCYNAAIDVDVTVTITQDFTLTETTAAIDNATNSSLRIDGGDHTIDGADAHRHITALDSTVTIADVTLHDGLAQDDCDTAITKFSDECGGAIRVGTSADVTILRSDLLSNEAQQGGAVFNEAGALTIRDSTIADNLGIYRSGGVGSFGDGAVLTVERTTIADNDSGITGGLTTTDDNVTVIDRSTISGNTATTIGGLEIENGTVTISNSTISGNAATDTSAGGIESETTLTLINSTVAFNRSAGLIGGFSSNARTDESETLTVRNTLFAGNTADTPNRLVESPDCVIFDGNLPGTGVDATNVVGEGTCGDARTATAIDLGPLQDNGGPTHTHAPATWSDGFDDGDAAICAASPIDGIDQRAASRDQYGSCDVGAFEIAEVEDPVFTTPPELPVWENEAFVVDLAFVDDVDLPTELSLTFSGTDLARFDVDTTTGRIEFAAAPDFEAPTDAGGDNVYDLRATVTDTGGRSTVHDLAITVLDIPECGPFPLAVSTAGELNDAIECANHLGAGTHTISLAADISATGPITPIERNGPDPDADATLVIDGAGHAVDGGDAHRLFWVKDGTVRFEHLTARRGLSTAPCSDSEAATCGGGIFNDVDGTVTIVASSIIDNAADVGGGVHNNGTMTLSRSTVSGNTAASGGGVGNFAAITIVNTTVSQNEGANGGGLIGFTGLVPTTSTTIINSTIHDNTASASFGGLAIVQPGVTVRNTIISGNSAGSGDGDCFLTEPTAVDSTNLDGDGSCGDAVQSASINLGPLADNAGPTLTHALLDGSSARDAGDDAICSAAPVAGLDQRGVPRPQFGRCDIGAFEYWVNGAPEIVATTTAIDVAENTTAVTDVGASDDVDAEGAGLTYSLGGGPDDASFNVDASTGVVTFTGAPDHEQPGDVDEDNVYTVRIVVTDSTTTTTTFSDTVDIVVTVTDVAEDPLITPLAPARLADTRVGNETVDGSFAGDGAIASATVYEIQVAGRGGVRSDAIAAVLNVTAVQPLAPGFLTVYPCGEVPTASSINYFAGEVVPNELVAKLSPDGTVCIFALTTTDVVVDVSGFVGDESPYVPLTPARLTDSRSDGNSVDGVAQRQGPVVGGQVFELPIRDRGGVSSDAVAVVLNVTTVDSAGPGFLTVYPCGDLPIASSVNYAAGEISHNEVVVTLTGAGSTCIFALTTTHLIVDVVGEIPPGTDFVELTPARLADSRPSSETADGLAAGDGAIAAGTVRELQVAGRAGVPADATAAVLNVTAVLPAAPGFISVYPCGDRPNSSVLNYLGGDVVANEVIAKLSSTGTICFFSLAAADLVVDVTGAI